MFSREVDIDSLGFKTLCVLSLLWALAKVFVVLV